jgi:uncharacterized protein (TIGR02246 family)
MHRSAPLLRLALLLAVAAFAPLMAAAQLPLNPLSQPPAVPNALTNPAATPGAEFLFKLEAQFAADVAKGGGAAFARWFAPDGISLANHQAPVIGREAIAAQARWTPDRYQLTWTPDGARMGPNGDTGFTWGRYTGIGIDREGNKTTTEGRYITLWKREADGTWKVALDASNEPPPGAADCCKLP